MPCVCSLIEGTKRSLRYQSSSTMLDIFKNQSLLFLIFYLSPLDLHKGNPKLAPLPLASPFGVAGIVAHISFVLSLRSANGTGLQLRPQARRLLKHASAGQSRVVSSPFFLCVFCLTSQSWVPLLPFPLLKLDILVPLFPCFTLATSLWY